MTTKVIGSGLSGGQAASSTSRYASSGPASARYGDSTTTSGTPGTCRSKSARIAAAPSGSVEIVDGADVVIDRAADVDRLDRRPVETRDRDDDPFLALGRRHDEGRIDRELTGGAAYWRLMNSIIATRTGTMITTR